MKVSRFIALQQVADVRTAEFEGRPHLVVPVIALIGGSVMHAVNAESPELVPAEEIMASEPLWAGRPVFADHPQVDGERVSGNSPNVLESLSFGTIFDPEFRDNKLHMDVWLDRNKASRVGEDAESAIRRAENKEMIEVSVGAFVQVEERHGTNDAGVEFFGVWRGIGPDHLAMLPEGMTGACSNDMGCGAPRAASYRLNSSGELEEVKMPDKKTSMLVDIKVRGREALESLRDSMSARLDWLRNLGMSDSDVHRALDNALFTSVPAFLGIREVFSEEGNVVYAAFDEDDHVRLFQRDFSVSEDGDVTLGENIIEVREQTEFVEAESACDCGGTCDPCKLAAASEDPSTVEDNNPESADDGDKSATSAEGETVNHEQRIAALIKHAGSIFGEEDREFLSSASEDQLARFETAADAALVQDEPTQVDSDVESPSDDEAKEVSEEEKDAAWLAAAPKEVQEMFASYSQDHEADRAELTSSIRSCTEAWTEEDLAEKSVSELRKIAQAFGKNTTPVAVNFGGRLLTTPPRGDDSKIPAAPSLTDRIRAARNVN